MNFEERLKAAVAASAAPVPEDFLQTTEQMIDRLPRKERIIMRNKLSYGLVLAIILCMLTLTAVAAVLLTGKELVETEVLPMAIGNDTGTINDTFTNEELAHIVALAQENGIQLSDSIQRALEEGEGYWEEEVILSLAKAQFGPYPGQWTLEEQYWFGEMTSAIGFSDYNEYHIPGEGDMTYEEAYAKAKEHIADHGHDTSLLDDRSKYALWRSCSADRDKDGNILCVWWNFWFEPLDADLPSFDLEMNGDGSLAMFNHQPGMADALHAGTLNCNDVQDYFTDMYGSRNKWTPEIFVEYVTILRQTDLTHASRGIRAFAATLYCLPPEGGLTADQALAIAIAALNIEDVANCSMTCFMVDDCIRWKVTISQYQQTTRDMVEMDAVTGEILEMYKSDQGHTAQFYVPRSVWEATPEANPDGFG